MKRALWTQPITKRCSPAWPCPSCANGTLALVQNSLVEKETTESRKRYEILGEPDLITTTFSAWLKCSNDECGEKVVVVGIGKVVEVEKGEDDHVDDYIAEETEDIAPLPKYGKIYQPLFCFPMPDMFELPEKCPTEVKSELRAGFRLFWSDQAAAAGRVRVSLERLMDHHRIPKRGKNKKGKFFTLDLNTRIKKFSERNDIAGKQLMALKWLGNTGSHEGSVNRDDVLAGFEILEYLIAEHFDRRAARVAKLARQLTRKHSPWRKIQNSSEVCGTTIDAAQKTGRAWVGRD